MRGSFSFISFVLLIKVKLDVVGFLNQMVKLF